MAHNRFFAKFYLSIFFASVYFADKSIARTCLCKSETLDTKAAWLDGNELAEINFTFKFYESFVDGQISLWVVNL